MKNSDTTDIRAALRGPAIALNSAPHESSPPPGALPEFPARRDQYFATVVSAALPRGGGGDRVAALVPRAGTGRGGERAAEAVAQRPAGDRVDRVRRAG